MGHGKEMAWMVEADVLRQYKGNWRLAQGKGATGEHGKKVHTTLKEIFYVGLSWI